MFNLPFLPAEVEVFYQNFLFALNLLSKLEMTKGLTLEVNFSKSTKNPFDQATTALSF